MPLLARHFRGACCLPRQFTNNMNSAGSLRAQMAPTANHRLYPTPSHAFFQKARAAAEESCAEAKQDIHIHCLSLDRARPRDEQWSQRGGPGAVPRWRGALSEEIGVVVVAGGAVRPPSRQAVVRPPVVQ